MNSALFAPFDELADRLLTALHGADGAHDLSHITRVWRNVKKIQQGEGGDMEILAAAVMLHDCVDVPKNSPMRSQASRLAAAEARVRLSALGWNTTRTEWVASAIESHSYSAGIAPTTLEASILQDADRLDALGYTGIARCFYTGGRMGILLYEPADPRGDQRALNDAEFSLDHFAVKLLNLAQGFKTVTGRKIAAQRHETVRSFYVGMLEEVG